MVGPKVESIVAEQVESGASTSHHIERAKKVAIATKTVAKAWTSKTMAVAVATKLG